MAVTPAYTTEAVPADSTASEYKWLSPIASVLYGQSPASSLADQPTNSSLLDALNNGTYLSSGMWKDDWGWANSSENPFGNTGNYDTPEAMQRAWEDQLLAAQPEALGKVERLEDGSLWIDEHGGTRDGTWYSPYLYDNGEFMGRFTLDPSKNIRLVDENGGVLFSGSGAEAGPQLVDALTFGINKSGKSKWEVQAQDPQGNWVTEVKGDPGPGLIGNFLTGLGMSLPMALGVAFPALGLLGGLGTAGSAAAGSAIGSLAGGAMRGLPIGDILKNTALSAGTAYLGGSLLGGGAPAAPPTALPAALPAGQVAGQTAGNFANNVITVLSNTGRLVGSSLGSLAGGALSQVANGGSSANQSGGYDPVSNTITAVGNPGSVAGSTAGSTAGSAAGSAVGGAAGSTTGGASNFDPETGIEVVGPRSTDVTFPGTPPLVVTNADTGPLQPNLSGLNNLTNPPTEPEIVVTGAPPNNAATIPPAVVAGGALAAGAAGASSALSGAANPTNGMDLSDYLTLGSLAIGGLGNLFGGGGGGSNGTIPAGFGSGSNGTFNQPLPTLPSTSPFSPQNLGARNVSKTYDEWTKGGYGSPTSYFNNVPLQSTPSVTQPYTKPAASVAMPDVRIPTLASVPTPRAPGADLLAAMLGQQDQTTGMARGGQAHGRPSRSTDSFAVRGAGTGREDKIPAVLSDGEYVMDAETVALLGDGSTDAGAQKLDQFRVNIRKHKGRKLAKGKFSANAKRPDAYLAGGLS